MDDIDRKLIAMLQTNARAPLKFLAEQVFLSPPAVSARIESLEKQGILTGYAAQVDLLKMGYHILAFINLEMSPKLKPTFYPFIQSVPNVLECNCVTGNYTMLIKVAFRSTVELDVFIGQLQQFGNTYTQIVFSTSVPPRGVDPAAEGAMPSTGLEMENGHGRKGTKKPGNAPGKETKR